MEDPVHKAILIIRKAGGTVLQGMILYSGSDEEALKAIEFLIDEWDFACVE